MRELIVAYLEQEYPYAQHRVMDGGRYGVTSYGVATCCVKTTMGAVTVCKIQAYLCENFCSTIVCPVMPSYFDANSK